MRVGIGSVALIQDMVLVDFFFYLLFIYLFIYWIIYLYIICSLLDFLYTSQGLLFLTWVHIYSLKQIKPEEKIALSQTIKFNKRWGMHVTWTKSAGSYLKGAYGYLNPLDKSLSSRKHVLFCQH